MTDKLFIEKALQIYQNKQDKNEIIELLDVY